MQKVIRHIIQTILAAAMLCVYSACSSSDDVLSDTSATNGDVTLSIQLSIPTETSDESTRADEYEEGNTYENNIDVVNGNYRFYFFDTSNKFIARFEPQTLVKGLNSEGIMMYYAKGTVPGKLLNLTDNEFKLMVLANWEKYDDANMTEETTIDDVCSAEWSQYTHMDNFDLATSGNLIPFYGIHTYNNVTFTVGETTALDEPVTMLRAMAKVEVILKSDPYYDLSFSSVTINRYNNKGYCAPYGVYSENDYGQGTSWSTDYLSSLHLVGDANDTGDTKTLSFFCEEQWEESGTRYEKWIAYLPEYDNINAEDNYCYIQAKFNIQAEDDDPYTIYFATYSSGTTDNSDNTNRLNLERNNLYRFNVTCDAYNYSTILTVSDWENTYETTYEFGDGQIVSPVSPWDDQVDIEVEY